jgi:hypothetical protein
MPCACCLISHAFIFIGWDPAHDIQAHHFHLSTQNGDISFPAILKIPQNTKKIEGA